MQGTKQERDGTIRPELLCPAGDRESLEAAILYGADAVYLAGKQFGMRAGAANFDPEQLHWGIWFAHEHNVQVYLTCNTLPHNKEIEQIPGFLKDAVEAGIDALIISDIGVYALAREIAPHIPIHVSVQAGIVNYRAAEAWYRMGAARVVLARELTLEEISEIRKNTPEELLLEAFVHGAICVSHAGRCLLSDYMAGRDANRGDCSQPCRWKYSLVEEKRPGQFYPIEQNATGTHILNANDLCMIRHIPQMLQAGIHSFKIEGRAKSAYYTAVVTNAYRQALDLCIQNRDGFILPGWIEQEMERVSHRPYSTGFYFGRPEGQQTVATAGYIRSYEVTAIVEGQQDGGLLVSQRNRFYPGDLLEALLPGEPPRNLHVKQIFDACSKEELPVANRAMQKLVIPCLMYLPKGTVLRKIISKI